MDYILAMVVVTKRTCYFVQTNELLHKSILLALVDEENDLQNCFCKIDLFSHKLTYQHRGCEIKTKHNNVKQRLHNNANRRVPLKGKDMLQW